MKILLMLLQIRLKLQEQNLEGTLLSAKEKNRDYTVDWVHLKLNDQAQRTVLCKDPFVSSDERENSLKAFSKSSLELA